MKRKKIVDVKGPATWGPVVAKRGDHLKVYAYIGDHPKTGKPGHITFVGKWRPGVDLHLSRKDAKNLVHILMYCVNPTCGDTVDYDFTSRGEDKLGAKTRILNKLKREGIR